MKIKELSVVIKGPLWRIHEISIENIDVTQKLKENSNEVVVKIKDLKISNDEILDVFIKLGAPNETKYTVELNGELEGNKSSKKLSFSKDYTIVKNGRIQISISKHITSLLN